MPQRFVEIKKQFLYYVEHIQNRILESNVFNALKERYQSGSLLQQKIIKYGFISAFVLLITFVPVYYFSLSVKFWSEFKDKRSLSLGLLKTRNYQSNFLEFSSYKLRKDVEGIIKKYKDKNYTIKDRPASFKEKGLKKVIYDIEVKHLNIRQAIQMGTELHDMPSAYLSSLVIKESKNYPKHYNVSFEVSVYFYKNIKSRTFSKKILDEKPKAKSRRNKTRSSTKLNNDKFNKKPRDKSSIKLNNYKFNTKPRDKSSTKLNNYKFNIKPRDKSSIKLNNYKFNKKSSEILRKESETKQDVQLKNLDIINVR